jgi:mannose/fructose/N-acetylgalactosamine-specific phosphotransferase system component IID
VTTAFKLVNDAGETYLSLQSKLDEVFPGLLTAAVIILCWWLMAKKKRSPIQVMLILVVVALVGCFVGFFDPGLTY